MIYGVDYYPEQWGKENLKQDIQNMLELGVNTVRMGEFCYSLLQDKFGNITVDWLKDVVKEFYLSGINTILCTPTASPPKRIFDEGIGVTNENGNHFAFGSRRHYCFNSGEYQKHIDDFVLKLATAFKNQEGVIGFQIDNEIGGDKNSPCYCDDCKAAFREYLKDKFVTIDNLNKSLGLLSWSNIYDSFEQIDVPKTTQTVGNPSMLLCYKRFCSDSAVKFVDRQCDIIKSVNNNWQVCTNIFGQSAVTDNFRLTKSQDYVAYDDYPSMTFGNIDRAKSSVGCKMCYGYKKKPFVRMEMQSGVPGADILFPTPKSGEITRNVFQAVANGANGIMFFRYRTALIGAEQYWHGVLGHDGVKGRLFYEVKKTGEMLKKIEPYLTFESSNKVALLINTDIDWAFKIQPLMLDYDYYSEVCAYARALESLDVGYDVINSACDISQYKMVIAPNYLFSDEIFAKKLETFAALGGAVVLDFRAGVKDYNNLVVNGTLPNAFSNLLGIKVREYGILNENSTKVLGRGIDLIAKKWYDYIEPTSSEIMFSYQSLEIDFITGKPAITRNHFGKGDAYYLGSKFYDNDLRQVIKGILENSNLPYSLLESEVQAIEIGGLKFVINFSNCKKHYNLEHERVDLLSNNRATSFTLNAGDVMVLK